MTWQECLKKDLVNVATGKKEEGYDDSGILSIIDQINDTSTPEEVAQLLTSNNLGWFAHQVQIGAYLMQAEAEGK